MEWTQTRSVLLELGNLLTCTICKGFLKDPCTLDNCDHNFCRKCIEKRLDSESKCPECGLFSWMKDLRLNHQLATTVNMTLKLQSLIGLNMEVEDSELQVKNNSESEVKGGSESLENTSSFDSDKDMLFENGELSDENRNDEQNSSSGAAECIVTIKPGTSTKESNRVRKTRRQNKIAESPSATVQDDTESDNAAETVANVEQHTQMKKLASRKHKKITEQSSALVQGDAESDSETNNSTTDVEKLTTGRKRSSRKQSNKMTEQQGALNGDVESNTETNKETKKENTYPKQPSDVRRSTRGDDKINKQLEVTQSNKTLQITNGEGKFARARKLREKKQIVPPKKNLCSKTNRRKASQQKVRKTFGNKLIPTSKTNLNLIGDPFDFTQQEDPFHFSSSTEDGGENNGYRDHDNHRSDQENYDNHDSDDVHDNDNHDNDESDQENYGDHDSNDDDHNNDNHENADDENDNDNHGKDDGSNKPNSASKLTRERSNPYLNGQNAENDNEILETTNSINTRLRKKKNFYAAIEQTKKKVQFTHLKDRTTRRNQADQTGVEKDKKTSQNGLNFDVKVVRKENKENVTLNIKRGRGQRRRSSILQYLTDVDRQHSSENSSSGDAPVPQKRRKSRSSSTSSSQSFCQSSQNAAACLSQKTRNKKGETLLHLAAIKGDFALARELIEEGADPNVKDHAGWTPLHEACNHGHVDVVKLFLDNDCLINVPGHDNDTPLHDAVANGHLKVVNLLVARGAFLKARNKQGLLPVDYAVTKEMKAALTPRDVSSTTKPSQHLENAKRTMESCRESQVILGTALKTQDQVTLKKCVKQLGGTLVDEFDESVTHVVTSVNGKGHCPRTIKYLCGILTGKWIISFEWIKDSLRKRQWLDEDGYEVKGTVGKTCNVARKARLNILQQMPRLLDGCSFFLRGVFNPPTPNKQDLIKLIQLGGGKLLHREPKVKDDDLTSLLSSSIVTSTSRAPEVAYHAPANSTLSCCTEFILYDSASCDDPKIVCSPVLRTAPVTWLMDCISSFQLLDIPDA